MKKIIAAICLLFFGLSFSQEREENGKFIRHFSFASIYKDGEWGETKEVNNTVVFNINDNGDVLLYKASGDKEYFRKISKIKEGKTDEGIEYQYFTTLDEKAREVVLILFNNGIFKLMFFDGLVQIQLNP